MPSSTNYTRDYKQEAKTAKQRGEQGTGSDSGSAMRHRARRQMLAEGAVKPGQDVDHKTPISKGGGNSKTNLRPSSPTENRSFPRTKSGAVRGK